MKVARQAAVRVVAPVAPRTDPTGDESSSRVVDEQD